MSINRIGSGPVRPSERASDRGKRASTENSGPDQVRSDRVEISDAGRALAAKTLEDRTEMTESRRSMIQERIAQGFYHDGSIAESIAHRLIDSGDLLEVPD